MLLTIYHIPYTRYPSQSPLFGGTPGLTDQDGLDSDEESTAVQQLEIHHADHSGRLRKKDVLIVLMSCFCL